MSNFKNYNVFDFYQGMSKEEIRRDVLSKTLPFAVMMEHWKGDFNIATLIRNANAFGAESVFYVGKKQFDRRGTVGSHHYVNLKYIRETAEIALLKERYHFICFENNLQEHSPVSLRDYNWGSIPVGKIPLMIFGEEGTGITPQLLEYADEIICIEQIGSVRSLNVGTCSGIAMYNFVSQYKKA